MKTIQASGLGSHLKVLLNATHTDMVVLLRQTE